jgi:hypothetical protein
MSQSRSESDGDEAARRVRAWAERQRLLHGLDQEALKALEACAQDLEEGFHA